MPRYSRNHSWDVAPRAARKLNGCRLLMVIDNRPLQYAAWTELQGERRRLEKATNDLHRHEEKDEPAFRSWLGGTFSTLVSAIRDLAQQVEAKGRLINSVQDEAFYTRRSPAAVWREWQRKKHTDASPESDRSNRQPEPDEFSDEAFEREMNRFFADEGLNEDDPAAEAFREFGRELFGSAKSPRVESPEVADARAIYRRLVQQLHPDRGGEWTPARARLWEQVQAAWSERDADCLARLEAEWDASNDCLGPSSPLGRLRAALRELEAARRDAERRVRAYRKHPAWRFTLRSPAEALRARLERELRSDHASLRRDLDEIEATIASWERTTTRRRKRRSSGRAMWQDGMPLF